ncbi:hypothetical protein ABZP36_018763 [Zizania latifolia]
MALHATPSSEPSRAGAGVGSDLPQEGERGAQRRPAAFYSTAFAQMEDVGWERLVSSKGDGGVSCLAFRVLPVSMANRNTYNWDTQRNLCL